MTPKMESRYFDLRNNMAKIKADKKEKMVFMKPRTNRRGIIYHYVEPYIIISALFSPTADIITVKTVAFLSENRSLGLAS